MVFVSYIHRLCVLSLVVYRCSAVSELSVNVYEGPKECDEAKKVKKGDFLDMHYTGTIDESSKAGEKGQKFDSSLDRGKTLGFTVGVGQVIKGWDQGLVGLCKGAKATLVIPPDMAYGDAGAGGIIPGGATLNFDVEVVGISDSAGKEPDEPNLFEYLDANDDGKISKEEVEDYFKGQMSEMPEGLFEEEDKDGDGFISWEEFGGPKGDSPPSVKDEL